MEGSGRESSLPPLPAGSLKTRGRSGREQGNALATTKQSILPVLWGAKMLNHQLEHQEGPHLGEGLLQALELYLQTPQPDPAIWKGIEH